MISLVFIMPPSSKDVVVKQNLLNEINLNDVVFFSICSLLTYFTSNFKLGNTEMMRIDLVSLNSKFEYILVSIVVYGLGWTVVGAITAGIQYLILKEVNITKHLLHILLQILLASIFAFSFIINLFK